jgi:hypothetical protein
MPGPGYGGGYPQGLGPGMPPGPGYGPPGGVRYGGYTAGGVPMRLKQSPGTGAIVGLVGIAFLLLSYFALPWISQGGESVSFTDMREAFHPDESSATVPGTGDLGTGTVGSGAPTTFPAPDTTLPPDGSGGLPPLNTVTIPELPGVDPNDPNATATPTPAPSGSFGDSGAYTDLKQYTGWGWVLQLYLAAVSVGFAALLVPRDRVARFVTGTLTVPCLGWVNFFDREGSSAPRVLSGLASVYGLAIVLVNAYHLYWEEPHSPDPGIGAWLAIVGAIAVFVACIIGAKREWVPEYS